MLEGGRVVESGSYRELVAKEGSRFRALMAAQLTAVEQKKPEENVEEVVEEVEEAERDQEGKEQNKI